MNTTTNADVFGTTLLPGKFTELSYGENGTVRSIMHPIDGSHVAPSSKPSAPAKFDPPASSQKPNAPATDEGQPDSLANRVSEIDDWKAAIDDKVTDSKDLVDGFTGKDVPILYIRTGLALLVFVGVAVLSALIFSLFFGAFAAVLIGIALGLAIGLLVLFSTKPARKRPVKSEEDETDDVKSAEDETDD